MTGKKDMTMRIAYRQIMLDVQDNIPSHPFVTLVVSKASYLYPDGLDDVEALLLF